MLNKLAWVVMWFFCSIFVIFSNTWLLSIYSSKTHKDALAVSSPTNKVIVQSYFQNDSSGRLMQTEIESEDGRLFLLKQFMKDTPLYDYADLMIKLADEYNIDYRLLPAIAMCESNLGVRIPGQKSFNAWGIAVYTGQQNGAMFQNWTQAIEWVYNYIADKYVSNNIHELSDIGSIWAPPSVEKGNSWANCVDTFMKRIE